MERDRKDPFPFLGYRSPLDSDLLRRSDALARQLPRYLRSDVDRKLRHAEECDDDESC